MSVQEKYTSEWEGENLRPYFDPPGSAEMSIGRGHHQANEVEAILLRALHKANGKIEPEESLRIFARDLARARMEFRELFGHVAGMTAPREIALTDMLYQMGEPRVAGFHKFMRALTLDPNDPEWGVAADNVLLHWPPNLEPTQYAKDSPERAAMNSQMIRTGEFVVE
ncbi:MAG: hypothetical protein WC551_11960 [Patescibacteria group bacterium]